jgi:di/tricarboxylate transporter
MFMLMGLGVDEGASQPGLNACHSPTHSSTTSFMRVCIHFLQGFQKTGLGERVANLFVAACGKSTLGLAYGLGIAEAFLAPAMPSTTARAGGIFMPIINSLSLASGSEPGEGCSIDSSP